jgi:hypothetical protein
MDFYKNQLNRVNGAMPMMPGGNDYMSMHGGGAGNLLGRMSMAPAAMPNH